MAVVVAVCGLLGCTSVAASGAHFKTATSALGLSVRRATLQCEQGSSNPRVVYERSVEPAALRRAGFRRTDTGVRGEWRRRYPGFTATVITDRRFTAVEVEASYDTDCRDLRKILRPASSD